MKAIIKVELYKTIKQEFKMGRDFCRGYRGRYFKMMIDVDDGTVWSDVFVSENDWREYRSDTILRLETVYDTVPNMEQAYLNDAIQKLKRAGWTIIE